MKYALLALGLLLVFVGIGIYFFAPNILNIKPKSAAEMKSFEDCVKADNLVVNTIPRECHTKEKQVFIEIYNGAILKDVIVVTAPKANQLITSPFKVEGEAVGGWYFAEQLNVRLEDDKGKILFTKTFKAIEDTKTDSMVPFTGAVIFNRAEAETPRGKLIIEKTNTTFTDGELGPLVIPVEFEK